MDWRPSPVPVGERVDLTDYDPEDTSVASFFSCMCQGEMITTVRSSVPLDAGIAKGSLVASVLSPW